MKFIEWPPPRCHPFPVPYDHRWARARGWIRARLESDYAVEEFLDPWSLF